MPDAVVLELVHDPTVNYALQQNDVPVIKQLRISNNGTECLKDVLVRVEAEPAFAPVWEGRLTSLEPGAAHDFAHDFGETRLRLSPDYLAGLTERVAGFLNVTINAGGRTLQEKTSRIDVLAYDEWSGLRSLPEILAAFVTPNYPAVESILSDAAHVLTVDWNADSGLHGYQTQSKKDALWQGGAIYEALRRRGLKYISPPASFEQTGQKIRLADRILEKGLGTCLDLTLLLASCLEQAGLNPLVILTKGHAFVGFWLEGKTFSDVAADDPLPLQKRIELKEICVVEATALTAQPPADFDTARRLGEEHLKKPEEFRCVIDIKRCRKAQIRPLPLPGASDNSAPQHPAAETNAASRPPDVDSVESPPPLETPPQEPPETPSARLERWKRRLLDLTLRNRLLNFKDNKKTVRILCPDVASLEDALADGEKFKVLDRTNDFSENDPRSGEVFLRRTGDAAQDAVLRDEFKAKRLHADAEKEPLMQRLLAIYRQAALEMEESGASTLYLALGFLNWYAPSNEKELRAPLILVPVELTRVSALSGYSLRRRDDEVQVNTTLLQLLKKDFQLYPQGLDPVPQDAHGVDVPRILNTFRKAVVSIDRWKIDEEACLGFFSFAKYLMWRDLESRTDDLQRNPVVAHLINTPDQPFQDEGGFPDIDTLDEKYSPAETFCPMLTDSSQLEAVYAAGQGKNFVLHGPPGTGKSQTITNIIAHCLALGKSVLFVSEKMAALTVVRDRLVQCGLGEFCLELHSNKSNKQAFIEQLGQALRSPRPYDSEHWRREAERIARLRTELDAYVQALHKTRRSGESVFHGLSRLCELREVPDVRLSWNSPDDFDRARLDGLWDTAHEFQVALTACGALQKHPWRGATCEEWSTQFQRDVTTSLQKLADHAADLRGAANELLPLLELQPLDEERLSQYAAIAEAVAAEPVPPKPLLAADDLATLRTDCDAALRQARRFFQLRDRFGAHFPDELLQFDFPAAAKKIAAVCGATDAPPWGGQTAVPRSPQGEEDALRNVADLQERIRRMHEKSNDFLPLLGVGSLNPLLLPRYESIAVAICAGLLPAPALMEAEDWEEAKAEVHSLVGQARRRRQLDECLGTDFTAELLTLDLDALAATLAAAGKKMGPARWLKRHAIRKTLRGVARSGKPPKKEQLDGILTQARELRDLNARWPKTDAAGRRLLGREWKEGLVADEQVAEVFGRREALIQCAQDAAAISDRTPEAIVKTWVQDIWPGIDALPHRKDAFAAAVRQFWEVLNQVCGTLGFPKPSWQTERGIPALADLDRNISAFLAESTLLGPWLRWRDALYAVAPLASSSTEELAATVRQIGEFSDLHKRWTAIDEAGRGILDEEWNEGKIPDERVLALFEHARAIRGQAASAAECSGLDPQALLNRWTILLHSSHAARLRELAGDYDAAYAGVREQGEQLRRQLGSDVACLRQADNEGPLSCLERGGRTLSQNMNRFREWCHWRAVRRQALEAGLQPVVARLERGGLPQDEIERVIRRGYYEWWTEGSIDAEPALRDFFGAAFEDKIKQFQETDDRYTQLTRKEIKARLSQRVPIMADRVASKSELGILTNELHKKKRHKPIRELIQKIPTVLPHLKPCLLMSPMSIAQYLDTGHAPFDLVIFDEASQIPVWDAVGAIARGRQAVIVGDPKQLPPTNFFQREEGVDEDDAEDMDDLESILDQCLAAQLPSLHLRWHYRSRNESLIAFSNRRYYNNELLTFPSPQIKPAVNFHYVHGVYDRGNSRTNRIEAEALVRELLQRFRNPSLNHDSIGVVTFNQAQRDLIADLLEADRQTHPEIEEFFDRTNPKRIFVKNLENVQGDERDVILFSVGYGPDAAGKPSMGFGPLNKEGGERRLNVAVTRARKEVMVFSSLRPEEIDLARTHAQGVKDLKSYMGYALGGMRALDAEITRDPAADFESPFEEQVCEALRADGHTVHAQVGCSGYRIDLAVVDPDCPGRYLIGIECDGATYHSAHTARDRDRLREMVLHGLGWQIARVWSTDWWNDREGALAKVESAIAAAAQHQPETLAEEDAPSEAAPAFETETDQSPAGSRSEQQQKAYPPSPPLEEMRFAKAPAVPTARRAAEGPERYQASANVCFGGTPEEFHLPMATAKIRQAIIEVMDLEAPISLRLLTRRVAARWGCLRGTQKCRERILRAAEHMAEVCVRKGPAGIFLWKRDVLPEKYKKFRIQGEEPESRRDSADIPPEEIANAARQVLRRHISLSREVLESETAYLLGYKRVPQKMREDMQRGIALLTQAAAVREDGDNLTLT